MHRTHVSPTEGLSAMLFITIISNYPPKCAMRQTFSKRYSKTWKPNDIKVMELNVDESHKQRRIKCLYGS